MATSDADMERKLLALIADRGSTIGEKQNACVALARVQGKLDRAGASKPNWFDAAKKESASKAWSPMRGIRSKYNGICRRCGRTWSLGDLITKPAGSEWWTHAACA